MTANEILVIDELLVSHSDIVPKLIQKMWMEAKKKGPIPEGSDETESDVYLFPFDLKKMFNKIERQIERRINRK